MAKWGMVIDLEKCTGCQACSTACGMENNRLPGENWQDVLFYTEGEYPSAQLKWFPRPCMQCENPSCVHVCPVKATYKTDDGVVLIDWDRCIGCRYCIIACPYGVRFFADENPQVEPNLRSVFKGDGDRAWSPPWKMPDAREDHKRGVGVQPSGVVSKCTFCYHRTGNGMQPACVEVCPAKARIFGDQDDPNSEIAKVLKAEKSFRLQEDKGTKPNVHYIRKYSARA